MAKEKTEKKEVTREEFDNLEAYVRRLAANWKIFAKKYIGADAEDGKMKGSVRICVLAGLAIASLAVASVFATDSAISTTDAVRYGDSTDHYSVRIGSSDGSGYIITTGIISSGGGTNTSGVFNNPTINAPTITGGTISATAVIQGAAVSAGNIPIAQLTNVLSNTGVGTALAAFNGTSLTNLTTANLNGTMSAANLTAATTASAINGTSITNISAANLRVGTAASAINGASITNIAPANLSGTKYSGTVTNIVSGTNVWVVLDGIITSVTILP